jgi:hypothetical protein
MVRLHCSFRNKKPTVLPRAFLDGCKKLQRLCRLEETLSLEA